MKILKKKKDYIRKAFKFDIHAQRDCPLSKINLIFSKSSSSICIGSKAKINLKKQ